MTSGITAKKNNAAVLGGEVHPLGLDAAIERSVASLLSLQHEDGHWVFELEADATIPAEYILLQHYLGTIDEEDYPAIERRIARYLRDAQSEDGGWPLFHGGALDISASVKAYFALKAAGDPVDAPHMARARAAILARGGARQSQRLHPDHAGAVRRGAVARRAGHAGRDHAAAGLVPVPPRQGLVLVAHRAGAAAGADGAAADAPATRAASRSPNCSSSRPRGARLDFAADARPRSAMRSRCSTGCLRLAEPMFPADARRRAIDKAVAFVTERLNGEDGLGGIFPAMANALMMFDCLGYPPDHPNCTAADSRDAQAAGARRRARLLPALRVAGLGHRAGRHALMEVGEATLTPAIRRSLDWLEERQVLDTVGDWAVARPGLRPGGWAFQYANPHYPDLDDTAAVALALDRFDRARYSDAIDRAAEWVIGMQSRNGGWGSFDADNTHFYLNHIPFADHGALLDPPTADVSARCVGFLAQLGTTPDHPAMSSALDYLRREQEADGSWFGRWGTNYIYGTWSVLAALNAAGIDPNAASDTARRRMAGRASARRRRLGRNRRELLARRPARRGALQHRLANRLGIAGADGGRRGR